MGQVWGHAFQEHQGIADTVFPGSKGDFLLGCLFPAVCANCIYSVTGFHLHALAQTCLRLCFRRRYPGHYPSSVEVEASCFGFSQAQV